MCVIKSVNSQGCCASFLQLQRSHDRNHLSVPVQDLSQMRSVNCTKLHSGFINFGKKKKKRGKMHF